jgi:glucosamine kinase
MPVLCLDLGGTKSVGALYAADGTLVARGAGPAGAVSLGVAATVGAVTSIWDQMGQKPGTAADTDVMIGLAGIGLRDRVAAVRYALQSFRSVRCVSDGYGALIDATGAKPGVLIVIGTGVVAMRLNPDGTFLTASGWGFPAGDLGSGAWIGLQATGGLTRYLDGVSAVGTMSDGLAAQLMALVGQDASAIMAWLTTGRAGDYARLAPVIAASDDPFARGVMDRAAQEIAAMADVLQPDGALPIHVAGGLGRVLLPYCAANAGHHDWRHVETDPLRGLYLVATGQAPDESLAARPGLGKVDYRA